MECKAALRVSSDLPAIIGIYPEWNVKSCASIFRKKRTALEYIQNGM